MPVNGKQLAAMMDGTLIAPCSTKAQTQELIDAAKKYGFYSVIGVPCFYPMLVEGVRGTGIVVGSGCGGIMVPTEIKVLFAKDDLRVGCTECDMVMNLPAFKSGLYDEVVRDIRAVKDAMGDHVLKCIIETPLLSDDEIRKACELVIEGGADYVKTAVGRDGPATVHHIEVMAEAVKGRIKMKASGGIRELEKVDRMIELGVSRFGVSFGSGIKLIEAASQR
ncbi:deoxyribose-phosphate aldolase [Harryflintia acetispora]|uniref:deoxyribose-phosphate aldolase n=1 Tax=Harryflintia acetispora TaxID=1849041 RepID=UPI001896C00B|nr:deoxyribose-phosphate aldolase [Harryflintia acetispora]